MSAPDQALRRAVAQLSAVAPTDREAVLQRLNVTERSVVMKLLATYENKSIAAAKAPSWGRSSPTVVRLAGLSPWLAELLALSAKRRSAFNSDDDREFPTHGARLGPSARVTAWALQALQASALEVRTQLPRGSRGSRAGWLRILGLSPTARAR